MKYKYIGTLFSLVFLVNTSFSQLTIPKNIPVFVATEGDMLNIRYKNMEGANLTQISNNQALIDNGVYYQNYTFFTTEVNSNTATVIRRDSVKKMYSLTNGQFFDTVKYNQSPNPNKKFTYGYPRFEATTNKWRPNTSIVSITANGVFVVDGSDTMHQNCQPQFNILFDIVAKDTAKLSMNNNLVITGSKVRYLFVKNTGNYPNAGQMVMQYRVCVLPKVLLTINKSVNGVTVTDDKVCQGMRIKYTASVTRKTELGASTKPFMVTWYVNGVVAKQTTFSQSGSNILDTFSHLPIQTVGYADQVYCSVTQDFQVDRDYYSGNPLAPNTHMEYYTYRAHTKSPIYNASVADTTHFAVRFEGACVTSLKVTPYSDEDFWMTNSTATYFRNGSPMASNVNNNTWVAGDILSVKVVSPTCDAFNKTLTITAPAYEVATVNVASTNVNNNTPVTFTTHVVNKLPESSDPTVRWKKNGQVIASGFVMNSITLTAGQDFQNGDVISYEYEMNYINGYHLVCFLTSNNVTMTVNDANSISSKSNNKVVEIYPLPFTGELNIKTDLSYQKASIFNTLGQCILVTKERKIDTSKLAKGVYVLKLDNGYSAKIIK